MARLFCQDIYKGIEGDEGEELYHRYRELNQAAGAEKASEEFKRERFLDNESGEGQE